MRLDRRCTACLLLVSLARAPRAKPLPHEVPKSQNPQPSSNPFDALEVVTAFGCRFTAEAFHSFGTARAVMCSPPSRRPSRLPIPRVGAARVVFAASPCPCRYPRDANVAHQSAHATRQAGTNDKAARRGPRRRCAVRGVGGRRLDQRASSRAYCACLLYKHSFHTDASLHSHRMFRCDRRRAPRTRARRTTMVTRPRGQGQRSAGGRWRRRGCEAERVGGPEHKDGPRWCVRHTHAGAEPSARTRRRSVRADVEDSSSRGSIGFGRARGEPRAAQIAPRGGNGYAASLVRLAHRPRRPRSADAAHIRAATCTRTPSAQCSRHQHTVSGRGRA